MTLEPERFLGTFAAAGADHLLVQAESAWTIHLHRVLTETRALGKRSGVVLDPARLRRACRVRFASLRYRVGDDREAGYERSALSPRGAAQDPATAAICAERKLDPTIEVDGGENAATDARAAGATAIVAGSAIFAAENYRAIANLRASAPRWPRPSHKPGRGGVPLSA